MFQSRRVRILPIVVASACALSLSGCALGQIHDATQKFDELANKATELPHVENSSDGKGKAALSYSGAESGTVTASAVLCTVHDGMIGQFAAPTNDDPDYDKAQSVVSSLWDTDRWVVTLGTNNTGDSPNPFVKIGADGVSLSGTITCGEITKF